MSNLEERKNYYTQIGVRYGLFTGVAIALLMILIQLITSDTSLVIKFSKYVVLLVALFLAISKLNKIFEGRHIFRHGLQGGLILSIVAGIVCFIIVFLLLAFIPELNFTEFSILPSKGQPEIVSGIFLLFEIFMAGATITFTLIQWYKGD